MGDVCLYRGVPAMNHPDVFASLEQVGAMCGAGAVVELGSWLGASAAALAVGMESAGKVAPFHLFDLWTPGPDEVRKAATVGFRIEPRSSIEQMCLYHVQREGVPVFPHRGRIEAATWKHGPIAVMVFDQAKRDPGWTHALRTFGPSWVADETIVCLLDFWFYRERQDRGETHDPYLVQERFISRHAEAFEPLVGLDAGSARFFRYRGGVDWATV
jgi:hypothetical protein